MKIVFNFYFILNLIMNKKIYKIIGNQLNLSDEVVEKTYKAFWLYVKSIIESLPLKEELSEEEFNKLKTNFNLPSLGKLSCTYDKIIKVKQNYKYYKNVKNK